VSLRGGPRVIVHETPEGTYEEEFPEREEAHEALYRCGICQKTVRFSKLREHSEKCPEGRVQWKCERCGEIVAARTVYIDRQNQTVRLECEQGHQTVVTEEIVALSVSDFRNLKSQFRRLPSWVKDLPGALSFADEPGRLSVVKETGCLSVKDGEKCTT